LLQNTSPDQMAFSVLPRIRLLYTFSSVMAYDANPERAGVATNTRNSKPLEYY